MAFALICVFADHGGVMWHHASMRGPLPPPRSEPAAAEPNVRKLMLGSAADVLIAGYLREQEDKNGRAEAISPA